MNFLTYNEKIFLIILITLTLIMIYISIYICIYKPVNIQNYKIINKNLNIEKQRIFNKNDNIYIIDTLGNTNNNNYIFDNFIFPKIITLDDMNIYFWNELLEYINVMYEYYNTFIIICSDDIIIQTSNILSFMIENLSKPIIFTKDIKNILYTTIPEVMIYNNNKYLRATQIVDNKILNGKNIELNNFNCLKMPIENIKINLIKPNINIILLEINDSNYNNLLTNKYIDNILFPINYSGLIIKINLNKVIFNDNLVTTLFEYIKIINSKNIPIIYSSNNIQPPLFEFIIIENSLSIITMYSKLLYLLSNLSNDKLFLLNQIFIQNLRGEYNKI